MQNICLWSVVCWESVGELKSSSDIESDCGIAGMFSNDVYICIVFVCFPQLGMVHVT